MKNTLALASIVLLSGCTNHLYSGTTSYEFNGKTCHSMVYWSDLTHLFDQEGKATTVVIKTPNGRSYALTPPIDKSTDGSFRLILPPSEFTDSINHTTGDPDLFCGMFKGKEQHQKVNLKETQFYLYCNKKSNSMRKSNDSMKAQESPYIFAMNEPVETFSWFTSEEIKADISVIKCE